MIPIKDNVLVKPFPSDNISSGGIIVSDAHKETSNKMYVVAVGNGTSKSPMKFKEGDVVFRIKDCGDEILINGEKHFLVKAHWLIAQLN
jgi:chaperonin GroES